jgi:uncharacterized DUF497 family protein
MSILFDWDEANIAHIAEHDVLPSEAEDVITSNPLDVGYEFRKGEMRLRQVGETSTGRILLIVSTMRNQLIRVITAHETSRLLRATYLKYKKVVKDGEANHS